MKKYFGSEEMALKALLLPTGYNGRIVGLDRLEGDMRNMNSADKVDDDACHKGKSAENNVSHDIAWGMWCSFRLYGGIQFQVKTAYTCFSLLTPWVNGVLA